MPEIGVSSSHNLKFYCQSEELCLSSTGRLIDGPLHAAENKFVCLEQSVPWL